MPTKQERELQEILDANIEKLRQQGYSSSWIERYKNGWKSVDAVRKARENPSEKKERKKPTGKSRTLQKQAPSKKAKKK